MSTALQTHESELQELNSRPDPIEKYLWLRQLQEGNPSEYYR